MNFKQEKNTMEKKKTCLHRGIFNYVSKFLSLYRRITVGNINKIENKFNSVLEWHEIFTHILCTLWFLFALIKTYIRWIIRKVSLLATLFLFGRFDCYPDEWIRMCISTGRFNLSWIHTVRWFNRCPFFSFSRYRTLNNYIYVIACILDSPCDIQINLHHLKIFGMSQCVRMLPENHWNNDHFSAFMNLGTIFSISKASS